MTNYITKSVEYCDNTKNLYDYLLNIYEELSNKDYLSRQNNQYKRYFNKTKKLLKELIKENKAKVKEIK